MPNSVEELAVIFVAILPGALHTWAAERESGRWGVGLSDRLVRFIGATAIYLAAFAYPTFSVWSRYLHHREVLPGGGTRFANPVLEGHAPGWFWVLPLAYVLIPIVGGTIAGLSINRWPLLSRILAGRDPAPRAWDFLFSSRPVGVIRARLKSDGRWIGGRFGEGSYAAGYPEVPQDLLLERTYLVLADGSFAEGTSPEGYEEIGSALLVKWEDIEELEFFAELGDRIAGS